MKYTEQEQLNEILLRGEKLRRRKDRNVTRGLSGIAAVLFFALAACIGTLGGKGVLESRTDYGSFLLSAETGDRKDLWVASFHAILPKSL